MSSPSVLPEVPVKHAEFLSYLNLNPKTPLPELLAPYKKYDAKLREVFAQEPDHPALADQYLNVVPVFDGRQDVVKIHARDLDSESREEKEKYMMQLDSADRLPNGSPAIVQDLKDFQQNFALFCESSLVDLDWRNVVAAGSSVVTCLLPVPDRYKQSKRALRQYYHEMIAPASDVDLFLYGLSEEEALKKIVEIEQRVKDSILTETTTIRTKNAITIASQYPTRHIQIVLRIYKSVSEILTGFDVDCSCVAYDGTQVWAAPRALTAYMTQTNTIDLTRRSPSYESRLSKYSHRGFEVYWPLLDRSRIDPTIFERNFARTVGLARLLVLERLPSKSEREAYMDERRHERGRPQINRRWRRSLGDNIKDKHEDEVAEWVEQEEVSDYHTFTIPYGPKYHAKKIEKLLYTKDLLLNAEWNKPKEREVNLHRHPAFFGYAEDIIHDCCGFCPKALTPEEHDIAEEESKTYVAGELSFIKDDPGRQAIGSFNPITDDDWTEMAYVGNTARLCQAIIDQDPEHVADWLAQEGADPNTRDYTGRTPLHLAVMCSSTEIVQTLINHGARLVARLADGRTALHLAAARGNVEMVRMILQRSEENEEEEAKKEDARKRARTATKDTNGRQSESEEAQDESDLEVVDEAEDSDEEVRTTTTGSFVRVSEKDKPADDLVPDEDDEPDVYDVNVVAWDTQCSPLHLAILNGHIDVVKELVQSYGADVLFPVKLFYDWDKSPRGAILTLVLALRLPLEEAKAMTQALLQLGASSAQADIHQTTALHYISSQQPEVLETLIQFDEPAAKRAINHLAVTGSSWSPGARSPLMSAISKGNALAALKLLGTGSAPSIEFKDWIKSVETQFEEVSHQGAEQNHNNFIRDVEQPVILAAQADLPEVVLQLLDCGVSPNTLTKVTQQALTDRYYSTYNRMESLLDVIRKKITDITGFKDAEPPALPDLNVREGVDYLAGIQSDSYRHFVATVQLQRAQESDARSMENYRERLKIYQERKGVTEKKQALKGLAAKYEQLEQVLLDRGAKTFHELHPDITSHDQEYQSYSYSEREKVSWSVAYDFSVHDLTEEYRKAYLNLFQAAWIGDLATIKSLTLAPWGPSNNTPLRITVQDKNYQSPFTIAVLRGHHDVARAIIDISFAQYEPQDGDLPKARYHVGNDLDSDEDGASDMSDIPVYSQLVDDKFTIENIGEVSTQVKSRVSPLAYMEFPCSAWGYARLFISDEKFVYGLDDREVQGSDPCTLQSWAILTNNKSLFSFLLDLNVEWTDRLANTLDGSSGIPSFSESDFELALEHGRLELLAEMIKHAGAGMELQSLVKKSGVKYRETPKYYQGLSVHGKKREDWIRAARGAGVQGISDNSPPLLQAAFKGSLQSVEWCLSDTPRRHYLDFAEAYRDDKFVKHLNTLGGGFDRVLTNWFQARSELALHCVIMAAPNAETSKVLSYLLQVMPESLETKSSDGYTPLALAFSLHRVDAAKLLIDRGADQTVRDRKGANILHLLLCPAYQGAASSDHEMLQPLLNLLDKRLVSSLLSERSSHEPGSQTPISRWLRRCGVENEDVLRMMLEFAAPTNNEHLELLDGSGDTPLHYVVKAQKQRWLKIMLDCRPDLLYRENSVGRTPYELAEDAYISECVSNTPCVGNARYVITTSILQLPPENFVEGFVEGSNVSRESIWRLCGEFMQLNPGKRRLVSLIEANEVANRLAKRNAEKHSAYQRRGHDEASDAGLDDDDSGDWGDEVRQWYFSAMTNSCD